MTNREFTLRLLADPEYVDDGGACYESWIYYHIDCPYFVGDERKHCDAEHEPSFNLCARCKMEWLDLEVDE
jgi:hypothetical protein